MGLAKIIKRKYKCIRTYIIDNLWFILRLRIKPEILMNTHYPGCKISIKKIRSSLDINITNGDETKIMTADIHSAIENLFLTNMRTYSELRRGLRIDFRRDFIPLENWRDIWEGRIQKLINDENKEYYSEKIGAFGYLCGQSKPVRTYFLNLSDQYPDKFEYLLTDKYSKNMKNYISLIEYKRRYKYVIDLPGHTYSTKLYWMMFLKRPLFLVKPVLPFKWENKLKKWEHYIPVADDLLDLEAKYDWAQKNYEEAQRISSNLFQFGCNEMGPEKIVNKLIKKISSCFE